MGEITDQKNSELGHFLCSAGIWELWVVEKSFCDYISQKTTDQTVSWSRILTTKNWYFYWEAWHFKQSLREKCPYSEFFLSECGKIRNRKTPNTDTIHAVSTSSEQKMIITRKIRLDGLIIIRNSYSNSPIIGCSNKNTRINKIINLTKVVAKALLDVVDDVRPNKNEKFQN